MTNLQRLQAGVEALQHAYDRAYQQIAEDIAKVRPEVAAGIAEWGGNGVEPHPLEVRREDGGYVLLDALTTLVNAQTAVVQAEAARRP